LQPPTPPDSGVKVWIWLKDYFGASWDIVGLRASIPLSHIDVEFFPAPHHAPSSLPSGRLAVYVFMLGDRCLKVGKAGPKSTARFCSQHYGIRAPSTLAKSLIKRQAAIGVNDLDGSNVKAWICDHTTRVNFLIPSPQYDMFALSLLEAFVQCRLRPEFEGFASQRPPATH
jgi:hypothetical protein